MYELIKELGGGGYGKVWEAQIGERIVAVKEFFLKSDAEKYLAKEAAILGRMDSDFIPALVDVFHRSFAMELVEGTPLNVAYKKLALSELLSVFEDVTEALAHIHARGVIHRDLKMHNVMVTSAGRGMLIDFGLSEEIGDQIGTRIGTPGYAPPESIFACTDTIEAHSSFDVYSLGCTFASAFLGHSPFRPKEGGMLATLNNCERGKFTVAEGMPAELWEVTKRCIARAPEDRPTLAEVLCTLREINA